MLPPSRFASFFSLDQVARENGSSPWLAVAISDADRCWYADLFERDSDSLGLMMRIRKIHWGKQREEFIAGSVLAIHTVAESLERALHGLRETVATLAYTLGVEAVELFTDTKPDPDLPARVPRRDLPPKKARSR